MKSHARGTRYKHCAFLSQHGWLTSIYSWIIIYLAMHPELTGWHASQRTGLVLLYPRSPLWSNVSLTFNYRATCCCASEVRADKQETSIRVCLSHVVRSRGRRFYQCDASAVYAMALCLSVRLSVCHKSMFYQNGET